MDLYQLEYFLEAARQRNFTRAAGRLHLAQAALSEQMRKLEEELGAQLFHRSRRETTLTAAGEVLREYAERLLRLSREAKEAVSDLVQLRAGRLSLGAIPSASACLLPPAIAAFRKAYAAVELGLLEGTSAEVAEWVETGRVEFGMVQWPVARGSFKVTEVLTEPFVVVVGSSHRLAKAGRVALKDLAQEGFVLYKGRAREVVLSACRSAGFEPRVACESGELETVRSLVEAGLGIAVLPHLAVREVRRGERVLSLSGKGLSRQVVLIQKPGKPLSSAAETFVRDFLLKGGVS
jgi:LysR family hydrogen peroxide-inducible transcriptional activator